LRSVRTQQVVWAAPAVVLVALWVYWAQTSGGYFPKDWYPSSLLVLGLAATVAVATGRAIPQARLARVALAVLAAFVAWSFLSLLWTDSAGNGWEAANKLLLLLACAWLVSLLPLSAAAVRWLLGAWSLGLGVVAVFSLAGAAGTDDLGKYLFDLRYQHPVGYVNGNAALAIAGLWPALALASYRGSHPLVAGLFLAVAVLLADFALLGQSRGSYVGVAIALPVFLLLAPDRLRVLARLLVFAIAVGVAAGPILDVYDVGSADGPVGAALDDAVGRIFVSALLAGVGGALVAFAERVGGRDERLRDAGRGVALALVGLFAVGVLAVAVASAGRIVDRVEDEISTITADEDQPTEGSRINSLEPYERPDYWRVAIDLYGERPVAGTGIGSYEREYTARREEPKHSRYAHNVFLRVASEEGTIGLLLLLGFLAAVFVCGALLRRRAEAPQSLVLAACLPVTAYVFVHANFDWLEEIPAVAAPAVALPILALAVIGRERAAPPAPAPGPPSRTRVAGAVAVGLLVGAALVSLVPAYLSVRYVDRASERGAASLDAALDDLDRARDLNSASLTPLFVAGRLSLEGGRRAAARAAFERSLEVEDTWYAHFELAMIAASEDRFRAAEREIAAAARLSSSDAVVARLRRRIAARRPVDPVTVNRAISRATTIRFTASPR